MRRWRLVPVLLLCLLLLPSLGGCSRSTTPTAAATTIGEGGSTTTVTVRTTTTLAPATWEILTPSNQAPAARLGGSLVYVSSGNQLLLFGGWTGGTDYSSGTWKYELATNGWTDLKPTGSAPSARASHAMAYDAAGNRLVVFGGYNGTAYYGDTWSYDLTANTWTDLKPLGTVPAARQGHSLVYDPQSKKMILFGGYDGSLQYNDTWAYDPAKNAWAELRPGGTLPAGRDSQAMTYDSDDKVMLMFGGWSATTQFADTWAYDPAKNTWAELKPSGGAPAARALHSMDYDPAIKKIVLFGGGTSSTTFNDVWLYDFTDNVWTQATASGQTPTARAGHGLVYDTSARQILLFAGSNGVGTFYNDLWRLRR